MERDANSSALTFVLDWESGQRGRRMSREIFAGGRSYVVDDEGYLLDFSAWTEAVAEEIATESGIGMTPGHWEVIRFLREYYSEYHIAPAIRILAKVVGKKLGTEKGSSKYLYELFPDGPAKQACKIAGLPKPTGCI